MIINKGKWFPLMVSTDSKMRFEGHFTIRIIYNIDNPNILPKTIEKCILIEYKRKGLQSRHTRY